VCDDTIAAVIRDIASASNPLVVRLRRQLRDPGGYRASGELWLEGDHLVQAWLAAGRPVRVAIVAASRIARPALQPLLTAVPEVVRVPDSVFEALSPLESSGGLGVLAPMPSVAEPRAGVPALVLDRLQDPGNVGSLLRTAAALGFGQVLSLRGTVALWSPKVLRAGMGAHTGLSLCEGLEPTALDGLALPLVATSSHSAAPLHTADLPWPLAWVLGHEGQGVSPAVAQRCGLTVSIPQPGGQESLNVAAAGAICLYESVRRRLSTAGAATV
jgi:TrmH family RNA methyltransferase